jgi:hypothetical protein
MANFKIDSGTVPKDIGMIGFSFAAGLHRRKDLLEIPGGFSKFYALSEQ